MLLITLKKIQIIKQIINTEKIQIPYVFKTIFYLFYVGKDNEYKC